MAKEEKQRVRREKRSGFYYDVSKMFLAGSGVSGLSPVLFGMDKEVNWYSIIIGMAISLFFAYLADKLLNKLDYEFV